MRLAAYLQKILADDLRPAGGYSHEDGNFKRSQALGFEGLGMRGRKAADGLFEYRRLIIIRSII